uniref:Transposase n=1 Tax=Candidatus Berkiella cookevillensis TaxID=437022 RepID=A0A0Q9Y8T9_9GAMM
MERWGSQLKKERQGVPPTKGKAITSEQRRIQELEAKIRKIEREKEILKKATALSHKYVWLRR